MTTRRQKLAERAIAEALDGVELTPARRELGRLMAGYVRRMMERPSPAAEKP